MVVGLREIMVVVRWVVGGTGGTGTIMSLNVGTLGAAVEDVEGAKSPGPQAVGHLDSGWLSGQPFWQTWLNGHVLPSRSAPQFLLLWVRESQTVELLFGA